MSFKNIKGQDRAIQILKGYLEQSRLAGGYLFTGPEGIGKRLVARELAKQVNCLEEGADPCDKCSSCMKIEANQHPDVFIIESADAEIKIEQIRKMQKDASLRPYEGKFKVFIIDNAHKLNAESSGALLKVLEEPPKDTLIILITDRPAKLFKTIISRCKILKFLALKRTELESILKKDYGFDNNLAHFLAYSCEGRFGRTLQLKDADIIRQKNRIIDKFVFPKRPYSLTDVAIQDREEVRNSLNILAAWFRDIYLIKIGMPHSELINFDRKEELLSSMASFSFIELNRILDSISDSIFNLERNINTKLVLYDLGGQLWKEPD